MVLIPTEILKRSKELFEIHKAKGFWEEGENRNIYETIMLMVSEITEGLESIRKTKRADLKAFFEDIRWHDEADVECDKQIYVAAFERYVKDTFEDELADTLIRVCDFIGAFDLYPDVDKLGDHISSLLEVKDVPANIGESLFHITKEVMALEKIIDYKRRLAPDEYKTRIQKLVTIPYMYIYLVAMKNNIQLDNHVNLKLFYNKTRPYKHGKAF